MTKKLVIVEIPLEIDYTKLKKDSICKVYFDDDSPKRIDCTIDGRPFTPKSVYDDLNIVHRARQLLRHGKFTIVTNSYFESTENKTYTDSFGYKKPVSNALEPKAVKQPINQNKNFNDVKNYILENNGKITVKDIISKFAMTRSAVTIVLNKLGTTKVRDTEYKWKGRRYFVVL